MLRDARGGHARVQQQGRSSRSAELALNSHAPVSSEGRWIGLQAPERWWIGTRGRKSERWCDTGGGGFLGWSERQRKAVAGRVGALVAECGLAREVGLIFLQVCPRDGHRLR